METEATADARVLTSVLAAVLSAESFTMSEDAEVLSTEDRDAAALIRALISVLSPVLSPASTAVNDAADALSAEERDSAALILVLISVLSPVLSAESFTTSEDTDALMEVDSDVTPELRVLTSAAMEVSILVLPFNTVVAKDGSFPMAVARAVIVLRRGFVTSPAMLAILLSTNGSVAITLALCLGCAVKSHCPVVVTLPEENVMLPETSSRFETLAVCMTAVATTAVPMFAVEMVALAMLATGMVAVPVSVAWLMGAFSRFKESSAFLRSRIS